MSQPADITRELAKASFTEEMLADMRGCIGLELRTESCVYNEYATWIAIMRFCDGIGDDNPPWADAAYAAATAHALPAWRDARARGIPRHHPAASLDRGRDRRDRGAGDGRDTARCDAALVGGRGRRRGARHRHQGADRADR